MGNQIHYEVFRRAGAKGAWTLHEVASTRELSIAMAQELMAGEKATGVKVVKETYNDDTGDFMSLKIFEEGHNQVKIDPKAEDAPHALPCFKPDDLYSYHARCTMARLLSDFLSRCKITVTELIHRADMLEKLEATGTLYQHAVQKVAVAQAANTAIPVQHIVKSLNELTTKAINRVYRDQRSGAFPTPGAEHIAPLAIKLAANPDSQYLFNGALARYLMESKGWDDKVQLLLKLMEHAPAEDAPRKLLLSAIDAIVAEILAGSAALQDLMAQFTGILRFLELFVLLLALLIAFNASAISVDERARDHATMFAFGVRPFAVLRGLTVEALLVGLLGTLVGIGLGVLAVRWIVSGAATDMPDLGMIVSIAPSTIATAIALGVLAVGMAPLFTFRRLRRMDVPSTLRVME